MPAKKESQSNRKRNTKKEKGQQLESGVRTFKGFDKEAWKPKTLLGKKVKSGEITSISEILERGNKILESEIVDTLLPDLESDLMKIGQSKGKFGGGKRSIWKQTQKKTKQGNRPKFSAVSILGNRNGYVGIGRGKSKETVPAREKATRQAKLAIIEIRRGCGTWACGCGEPHSIPFKVEGKCGSVKVKLIPAAKGTGLVAEPECKKLLEFAGIKDVYSKTFGQTKTKTNLLTACFRALKQLRKIKVPEHYAEKAGVVEGKVNKKTEEETNKNE